jgi:hypothetical protein
VKQLSVRPYKASVPARPRVGGHVGLQLALPDQPQALETRQSLVEVVQNRHHRVAARLGIDQQAVEQLELQARIERGQGLVDQDQAFARVPELGEHPGQLDARLLPGQGVGGGPADGSPWACSAAASTSCAKRGRARAPPPQGHHQFGGQAEGHLARLGQHRALAAQLGQRPVGQGPPAQPQLAGGRLHAP